VIYRFLYAAECLLDYTEKAYHLSSLLRKSVIYEQTCSNNECNKCVSCRLNTNPNLLLDFYNNFLGGGALALDGSYNFIRSFRS